MAHALGPADAWGFIEAISGSSSLRFLGPTERHAAACAEVLALRDPSVAGLPPSFATAVLLREHGVRELLSTDRGMRRWRFLDVRHPFEGVAWTSDEPPARRYRKLAARTSGT